MKTTPRFLLIVVVGIILPTLAYSQNRLRKFESAEQFSALSLNDPDVLVHDAIGDPGFIGVAAGTQKRNEPGVGGRFTHNVRSSLALEAETNVFARTQFDLAKPSGRIFQG